MKKIVIALLLLATAPAFAEKPTCALCNVELNQIGPVPASCPNDCADGQTCVVNGDCLSNSCPAGFCISGSCSDGIQNGTEAGIAMGRGA